MWLIIHLTSYLVAFTNVGRVFVFASSMNWVSSQAYAYVPTRSYFSKNPDLLPTWHFLKVKTYAHLIIGDFKIPSINDWTLLKKNNKVGCLSKTWINYGLQITLSIFRVYNVNKGLPIFVYAPTTNLCFVLHHSLDLDTICWSYVASLWRNDIFEIEISYCFVYCACGCRDSWNIEGGSTTNGWVKKISDNFVT